MRKIQGKRRLRKRWHRYRTPENKRLLNQATRDLIQLLLQHRNDCVQTFLQGLTPSASTDYSLWTATKRLKRVTAPSLPLRTPQGTWARSNLEKAQAFADHLASVFQPHPPGTDPAADEPLHQLLETPYQLDLPIFRLTRTEIQTAILSLHPNKSPGYDLITIQILQALPQSVFNMSPNYSMPSYSTLTSLPNGK
jgi:hypothetical protein